MGLELCFKMKTLGTCEGCLEAQHELQRNETEGL